MPAGSERTGNLPLSLLFSSKPEEELLIQAIRAFGDRRSDKDDWRRFLAAMIERPSSASAHAALASAKTMLRECGPRGSRQAEAETLAAVIAAARLAASDAEKAFLHDVTRAAAAVAALASARLSKFLPAKERRRAVTFARKRALSCMEELFCGPGDPQRSFAETLCIGANWTVVDRVRLLKCGFRSKSATCSGMKSAADSDLKSATPGVVALDRWT